MFILILTIGIITAVIQILASFNKLKDSTKPGIRSITGAGWFFYVCTIILAVLPAIQKVWQDGIDDDKSKETAIAQDKRDDKLRERYDSSLYVMKGKFDTTTKIVTETLGKYGYKLDSTKKVLVSIRDSAKTRVLLANDPVLQISTDPNYPGIVLLNESQTAYKIEMNIVSIDAGSAHFNVKRSFILADSTVMHYVLNSDKLALEPNRQLAKGAVDVRNDEIPIINEKFFQVFIWLRGTYRRIDDTGLFTINDVYSFNFKTKVVNTINGDTRRQVIEFAQKFEK
jgi:hypothetical protein